MPNLDPPVVPRVVLLTSPGLFGGMIIRTLAAEGGIDLVGVGLTNRIYKGKGFLAAARTFLQRTGVSYTVYSALVSQFAWVMLRMRGRPAALACAGRQVRALDDVNSPETIEWLKSQRPDFIASFYFNQWIGAAVRAVPQRACVNMHPSLLPALRGPDPVFRALERGLTTTGLTLHLVNDQFDEGGILYQQEQPVADQATVLGLYLAQVAAGAEILARWLATPNDLPCVATPPASDAYTTFPTPGEVRQFLRSGKRLLRLSELLRAIRQVR